MSDTNRKAGREPHHKVTGVPPQEDRLDAYLLGCHASWQVDIHRKASLPHCTWLDAQEKLRFGGSGTRAAHPTWYRGAHLRLALEIPRLGHGLEKHHLKKDGKEARWKGGGLGKGSTWEVAVVLKARARMACGTKMLWLVWPLELLAFRLPGGSACGMCQHRAA